MLGWLDFWIGTKSAESDLESIKEELRHIRDGNEKNHKYLSIISVILVINQPDVQNLVF